jgi:voltage-gated sodium channel
MPRHGLRAHSGDAVAVVDLAWPTVPGASLLRLGRIVRVLRIFRRLRSLRVIVGALAASLLPVANALAIMALVTCVYAILGTQLYRAAAPEIFGDFTASLLTVRRVRGHAPSPCFSARLMMTRETIWNSELEAC